MASITRGVIPRNKYSSGVATEEVSRGVTMDGQSQESLLDGHCYRSYTQCQVVST
jgi:hypothetical protein